MQRLLHSPEQRIRAELADPLEGLDLGLQVEAAVMVHQCPAEVQSAQLNHPKARG